MIVVVPLFLFPLTSGKDLMPHLTGSILNGEDQVFAPYFDCRFLRDQELEMKFEGILLFLQFFLLETEQ